MAFHSILFEKDGTRETPEAPAFFTDLNLDQVIDAITRGRGEYDLKPFFYTLLGDAEAIQYRHQVMQDLENPALFERIRAFAQRMRTMRDHLTQAGKLYYKYQKERWFLEAAAIYCQAIGGLAQDLNGTDLKSRGFLSLRDYVNGYARSDRFVTLLAETEQLQADLSAVQYCLHIDGNCVTVRRCGAEADYSASVEATFEKFKQRAPNNYRVKYLSTPDMNHVEAKILELVARLHADVFSRLDQYCAKHSRYVDDTIKAFDREVQFYVAYLEFIARFRRAGLTFCYPQIATARDHLYDEAVFDIALADKLIGGNAPVVENDFYLQGQERIFVVSGPNQGGKTTFARTFGQVHYLASIGCLVPGREARLFLFDQLFTHFEKEEDITNLRGKLKDDLIRIHAILSQASPRSIIIMNEIFTSTTLEDAVFLSKQVLERIIQRDLLCVCVTFIDELASLSEKIVSMVSTIVPENPALRTFKIVRKPADGLAYALSIAEKYRLTYHSLRERIRS
jgi:DNA mismatch repair protein MutS